jgi:hypothetical protein
VRDNRLVLVRLAAARRILSEAMDDPGVKEELRERLRTARRLVDEVFDMLS